MTDIELEEEDLAPVAHVTMVYNGPVAPHWEMRPRYGEQRVVDDFWTRVKARLLLLPKHDPQFRRNRERVNRDAERERIVCDWDLGDDDPETQKTVPAPAPGAPGSSTAAASPATTDDAGTDEASTDGEVASETPATDVDEATNETSQGEDVDDQPLADDPASSGDDGADVEASEADTENQPASLGDDGSDGSAAPPEGP